MTQQDHSPQQPLDELQALVGHVRFREGLLADFGMALTRNGETVSDSILGSDLSETAPVLGRAADALERQAQEIQRLREALSKYEGVLAGSWFYPEDDTSSDACCTDPHEVLDERYFYWQDGPRTGVFTIERAAALPPIYAAVRAYSDAEKDERNSDDDYDATFHTSLEEARAALSSQENKDDR